MVAIPLLHGRLVATDYEDDVASDVRVDQLRAKMSCVEDPQITLDYHDPEKRSIANGLTVELNDGTILDEVFVEYPVGHKRRREEGRPLLIAKFRNHLQAHFTKSEQASITSASEGDLNSLENMDVDKYVDLFVKKA
jgi:2-methylcitrate dehydratase